MIDFRTESLLTISQAARRLPWHPHPATLNRWSANGLRGVKLELIRLGGRTFTSEEALCRFFEELNQASRRGRDFAPWLPEASRVLRHRASAEVSRRLDEAGL